MKDSWKRDADAMVIQHHFHDFWASRWGGVENMKKIEFSLGRCRRMHFWRSHAAWGSQKKTIPMQHGKAETENRDTSRARTSILTDHWILLLWIFVDLGSAIWHPRREFKGKLENYEKYMSFWKSSKWKMLLKPLVGARFRSEEVTTTNNSIWGP